MALSFRPLVEVFDETIFNELVTTYFRDLVITGQPDTSDLDPTLVSKRHEILNWLCRFSGIDDWDHTDTST